MCYDDLANRNRFRGKAYTLQILAKNRILGGITMIESVYSSEVRRNSESALIKVPKNVRQVGQASESKKIYIEDYVMSYIKQVGTRRDTTSDMVVLLGQFVKMDNCQCIFISGAVEAEDVLIEENMVLTNETWNSIYEKIKEYFSDVEIVGWGLIKAGISLLIDEKIRKIHVDNFAGQDKTLLLYDGLEREEAFYIFEGNKLRRQKGYYIYYDKNPQMQSYMISMKKGRGIEQGVEMTRVRRYTSAKKSAIQAAEVKKSKFSSGMLYGAGVAASVVVLVLCVAALNGKGIDTKQNKVQDAISNNIVSEQPSDKNTLPIETVQGTLSAVDNSKDSEKPSPSAEPSAVAETSKASVAQESSGKNRETESPSLSPSPSKAAKAVSSKKTKPAKKAVETTSHDYYVVKKGDTLVSICKKMNKTTSYIRKIKKLNDIDNTNKITVGQKILLP